MHIISPLSPDDYRNAVRASLSNFSNPYRERFTGFFIGKWFYLSHHCEHEYGHRNTPHCAAVGYIKKVENGSELHYLSFRGMLCPLTILPLLILWIVICLSAQPFQLHPISSILIGTLLIMFLAGLETIFESLSERSQEGVDALTALIDDPIAPFRDE